LRKLVGTRRDTIFGIFIFIFFHSTPDPLPASGEAAEKVDKSRFGGSGGFAIHLLRV